MEVIHAAATPDFFIGITVSNRDLVQAGDQITGREQLPEASKKITAGSIFRIQEVYLV